jgi:hypothetical protein
LDVAPNGVVCAGSWNAPYYSVCTPGQIGQAEVTASALDATSAPTLVYVHPAIDNIQISVVPPVNSPPPACPNQAALPRSCAVPFNAAAANYCLSSNQLQTLQATAYSKGTDITSLVGPFTWTQTNLNVLSLKPIVTSSSNVTTNQATISASTPGQTLVVATASGVSSQPYSAETCPVQCIALQLGDNGTLGITSFNTNKGTSETITATAVDVQGCIVPKPTLTWTSTSPAAISAGNSTTGCGTASSCTISTTQPGAATITASCTPPSCNVGFPVVPAGLPALYVPQPVYPVTPISGLVTGATATANVLATSQDCYSNASCPVAFYDISTSTNLAGGAGQMPTPPNSLLFDSAGDKAYAGSQFGAVLITSANLGSSTASPFSSLPASGTPLGLVTGRVIGVSPNGSLAVFSDTVSTPNQVYVANTASTPNSTPLNINGATLAVFSPDNSKAYILGDSGNTLYVYSALQALKSYPLSAPADAIAFNASGAFAFIAGGSSTANITVRNTCDNSPVNLAITGLPATPTFLKMIPPGSAPIGNATVPSFPQDDLNALDIFLGVDSTGIDVIATNTTTQLSPPPTSLCPLLQQISLATAVGGNAPFQPIHINLQKGTFRPLGFFVSPNGQQVYIVTSDLGVLVYNFDTQTVSAIPLNGGAAPIAADMTADGNYLYVAGTDGLLHQIVTTLETDQTPSIFFPELTNSSNNFCYANYTCTLNLIAVKP